MQTRICVSFMSHASLFMLSSTNLNSQLFVLVFITRNPLVLFLTGVPEMGRDWYWSGGPVAKPSSTSNRTTSERHSAQTTLSGCITAVFHLFGSHRFRCHLKQHTSRSKLPSLLSRDSTIKGSFFHSLSSFFFPFSSFEILGGITCPDALQVPTQRRKPQLLLQLHSHRPLKKKNF